MGQILVWLSLGELVQVYPGCFVYYQQIVTNSWLILEMCFQGVPNGRHQTVQILWNTRLNIYMIMKTGPCTKLDFYDTINSFYILIYFQDKPIF